MSINEYFHVFEAIIYGIALTEILIGISKMIEARKTIKLYWAHIFFVITYISILFNHYTWQFYINSYSLVDSPFTFMIFVAIFPMSFFFGAYQAFPKDPHRVDFKVFFSEKRKEMLVPVLIMQITVLFVGSSNFISTKGVDFFFTEIITSFDFWLIGFYLVMISIAAFHKKLWPAEVLALVGLIGQTYLNLVPFDSIAP